MALMRRSNSAELVTATAFWPTKAERSKTSRPTPVSSSPTLSPVRPGTGSSVPV